jgi:hypothetical protein
MRFVVAAHRPFRQDIQPAHVGSRQVGDGAGDFEDAAVGAGVNLTQFEIKRKPPLATKSRAKLQGIQWVNKSQAEFPAKYSI